MAQGDPSALSCDIGGTWAIKVTTPVKWAAGFIITGSQGTVTNYIKSVRTQNGVQVTDTAKICGTEVPDYQATPTFRSEKYGIRFAPAIWDAPSMPSFTLTTTLSSPDVGATFTTPPAAALIGATMANPTTDPWPAAPNGLTSADSDGDGQVGVSADSAGNEPGHSNPPLSPSASPARANRVYTAFRQVMTLAGKVTSCTRVDGTAHVVTINNKPALDSHVIGCRHEDGSNCSPSESGLLDGAAPKYVPTADSTVVMVKIPDNASCADVRAANFQ